MPIEMDEIAEDFEELTLLSQQRKYHKVIKRQATAYEMWLNEKSKKEIKKC